MSSEFSELYIPTIYLQADHKKKTNMNSFTYFLLLQLQFSNLQPIPSCLVAILLVLEGSIILVKSEVYFLTLNGHLAI
jgi:hypothetical protein